MKISPNLEKFISPQTPKETRLMAAKAVLPMGPKDLVAVLSILISDTDLEVSETARKSLEGIPSHLLLTVLDGDLDPLVIKTVVNIHKGNDAVLVMAALNHNTDDETMALMASNAPEGVARVIAENQTRLMRNPSLLDALKTNPSVGKSVVDRVTVFLISVGKIDPKEAAVPMPAEVEPLQIKETEKEAVLPAEEVAAVDAELKIEKEAATEAEKESLYKRVQHLNVSEKIKLALLGNKEARDILMKDSNKLVSSTVLKNPRITEDEITKVVNSRSISDDILRQVAGNKEWLKKYPIKLGMVNNPKTPLTVAIRLLNQLNGKDVQHIAKSKNVSSALSSAAKKVVLQKEKK
ncbi:MAG: hypothetical protein AAB313_01715 [Deltaproteobacteria bacterium]